MKSLGDKFSLKSSQNLRCTPSNTEQKVSRPSVARSFAKMVPKVLQINSEFCDFFAMATSKQLPGVVVSGVVVPDVVVPGVVVTGVVLQKG